MLGSRPRKQTELPPDGPSADAAEVCAREAETVALSRCRRGDRDAFRILVEANERAVTGVVARIVLHPQEVEDLVQETFVQAYCKLSSFRGESSFRTWLYRIAVNLSLRRLQQLRRMGWAPIDEVEGPEIPDLRPGAPQPEREAIRAEERRALREALTHLSDAHRAVVTLHYFEEKSCPEIARILGCSVGTVWSRLHYALRQLRARLPDGGEP